VKALTISQPFASLILFEEKWVENRRWGTHYRGPLAIHAGKGTQYLDREELRDYPIGCVIAIARLAACMPLQSMQRMSPTCKIPGTGLTIGDILAHKHTEGPWCWILTDVRAIELIDWPGLPGLWDWPGCRVCGCTERTPCIGQDEQPCHWVEEDLCSRCAGLQQHAAMMTLGSRDPDEDVPY
jgi:hypothetical protein